MIVPTRRLAAVVATLALAASITSLANDFTYDDRVIIVDNPRAHSLSAAAKVVNATYWPQANGAALYRPLTIGLFAAEWSLGEGSPRVFHAVSIALYVVVCLGVFALLSRLLAAVVIRRDQRTETSDISPADDRRRAKLLAVMLPAALFAVHPVHVEAVGNVVGQSELVAALALLVAVAIYLINRLRGELGARSLAVIVVFYLVGCLAKEHAVVLPALLAAAELTVLWTPTDDVIRWRRLRPIAALAAAAAAYLALRAWVVGGVRGEFPHLAMRDASFAERLFTMLRVAPEWVRLLFWPARLSVDYSPREIELARTLTPTAFAGLLLIAAAVAIAVVSWRRRPLMAFGIAWIAIALLPVSNIVVPTGILLAERTLFLASIGAVIVVAGVIEMVLERTPHTPWRLASVAVVGGIVVLAGLVQSADRQRIWKDNATFFAQMLVDAPLSYRAHWANGARLFEAGKPEQGEHEMRIAIALFPHDADLQEDLASRYFRAGLCVPAVPAFRSVLEIEPDRTTARMGLAACLLRQGDYRAAALAARSGPEWSRGNPELERLALVADSLAGAR